MGLYQWSWIDKPPGDGDGAGEAGGGRDVDVVRHKKPRGAPKRFHTWCEVAGAWVKDTPRLRRLRLWKGRQRQQCRRKHTAPAAPQVAKASSVGFGREFGLGLS